MELVIATVIGVVTGALIPLIGLRLQAQWKEREITLKHEETLFQKRLEIASKTVTVCYQYFTISHKYALVKEEDDRSVYRKRRAQLNHQIYDTEPEIDLFFPPETVTAFRTFLTSVDEIIESKIPWTSIGSRLDSEFTTFVNKVRSEIGIEATESRLTESLPQGKNNHSNES